MIKSVKTFLAKVPFTLNISKVTRIIQIVDLENTTFNNFSNTEAPHSKKILSLDKELLFIF